MALVNPHPALKVSVPMNPMVDGWMGDDWFHNGAFRQQNMPYIYEQEATRKNDAKWWTSHYDDYDMFMQAGSAGELGRRHGLEQVGFWRKLLEHPSYDAFWRDQAVDKMLAAQPLKVPVMLVHSLWDQEDIYGAPAVYKAIEPKDTANDKVFLVIGPVAPRPGDRRRQRARRDPVRQRHRAHVPARDPAPVPRPVPQGRRAQGRRRAGDGVRDGHEHVAAAARLAGRLRERLHGHADAALPARRARSSASTRRRPATRPSTNTSPIPAKPVPFIARARCDAATATDLGAAGWWTTSAKRRAAPTCSRSSSDVADRAGEDQRPAGRQPGRLHQRHRLRLGGEADRRLSGRGRRPAGDGRLSADGLGRHLPRALSRELRDAASRSPPTSRCPTASRCRPPTTSSCRATGSWCRCSRAGSRSTTATRRRSCRTSSGRSRGTTGRPRSASTTRRARRASSSCRWSRRRDAGSGPPPLAADRAPDRFGEVRERDRAPSTSTKPALRPAARETTSAVPVMATAGTPSPCP